MSRLVKVVVVAVAVVAVEVVAVVSGVRRVVMAEAVSIKLV